MEERIEYEVTVDGETMISTASYSHATFSYRNICNTTTNEDVLLIEKHFHLVSTTPLHRKEM